MIIEQYTYGFSQNQTSVPTVIGGYIKQISIQTLPGVMFQLGRTNKVATIVGNTGIYELELPDGNYIDQITFDENTFKFLDETNGYLIVDIVKEEGGE